MEAFITLLFVRHIRDVDKILTGFVEACEP